MAKKSRLSFTSEFFLQLALGVFFLMLGIMGLDSHNSKLSEFARFLGRDDTLRLVMSIVELLMGGVLVLGLFLPMPAGFSKILAIALFVLWALYIVVTYFLNGRIGEPTTTAWLYNVSWTAIILVALWVVGKKYM